MIIINIYNVKWKRKYTYKEIAKFSGLSDATITKITRGEHVDLKLSTLEKLAKFFECSVKDLLVEVPDKN
ncbi:transcriptional regulator [Clostridium sp. CAG:967]|nr:transcriptional regulator [Clostridium sp. CAG:967]